MCKRNKSLAIAITGVALGFAVGTVLTAKYLLDKSLMEIEDFSAEEPKAEESKETQTAEAPVETKEEVVIKEETDGEMNAPVVSEENFEDTQ